MKGAICLEDTAILQSSKSKNWPVWFMYSVLIIKFVLYTILHSYAISMYVQLIEGNGLQTCQSSLFYVFVGYFGGWSCTCKAWQNTKGGYKCMCSYN